MSEDRLNSLLLAWQDQRTRGRDLGPAELCRDCPDLADELGKRIDVLRRMLALMGPGSASPAPAESALTLDSAPADAHTGPVGGHTSPTVDASANAGRGAAPLPNSIPGYEILGELGRGGMGVVYQARQHGLNRLVALKMILAGAHASSAQMARFGAEAAAVASLQHPNIVQIYEIGEHQGSAYFSLEYVEGGSLAQKLAGTPQQPRFAAALVQTLAWAVHSAHEHGIVHRDLKPANILLTAAGTPKVTDFGLAKQLAEDGQTRTGEVMGTPSYMAPEQATGETRAIGPAADVYALGAVLYECLTGRPPFRAASQLDTLMQVVSVEPVHPARLQPTVPRDLETICLKCLEKDPKRRYGSAAELADDLRRFLGNEPILARPATRWERARKWARRRPAVAALSGALAVVLLLGFTGITWKYLEAEALRVAESVQRAKAEAARTEAEVNAAKERAATALAQKAEARALHQEKQARVAEAEARAEAVRRQYVSDFLLNLFKTADPVGLQGFGFRGGHERGQSLTARDLLERGAARVTLDLKDQPELQATTLDTLGNTLRELGAFDQAERLLKQALDLRRKVLPRDHPDLGSTLHNLGWVYHDRGDYRRGLRYYEEAYAVRKKGLGAEHPATAASMFNLAWLLAQIGDYPEAEKLFRAVVALRLKQHGRDDHRDVAVAQVGLAALLLEEGRAQEALSLTSRAIKTLAAQEGDRSISIAITKFQQGVVAQQLGFHAGAVRHLNDCLTIARRILGENNPYLAVIQTQLAISMAEVGNLAGAEQTYRAALDVTRKSVGMQHPKAVVLVESAAALLARRHKRAEAEGLFEELLKVRRTHFGSDDAFVAEGLQAYAGFVKRDGDATRAEGLYREALAIFRKAEVRRVVPMANAALNLGLLLQRRGALAEAETLLMEAVAIEQKLVRKDPRAALLLRQHLFDLLVEQGKFAAVRPGLKELVALHRAQKTAGVEWLRVLAHVGAAHCEVGEFTEAEALFREALARARKQFAELPTKVVPHLEDLGRALLGKGARMEAAAVFTEAAAVRLSRPLSNPADFAATLRRLALVRLAAGDGEGCRETAGRLLDRLAETQDHTAAALVVRGATLQGVAADDRPRLIALAELSVQRSPSPANLTALGAALCRAGRYPEAVARLNEARQAGSGKRPPQAALFLALAHRGLGQADRARQWLKTAVAEAGAEAASWEDRLERELLLREVRAAVK